MLKFLLPIAIILTGCEATGGNTARDLSFSPIGTWSSDDGFSLEIKDNMTYTACDNGRCNSGTYVKESSGALIVKDFLLMESSKRFANEAEITNPCGEEKTCADSSGTSKISSNDLYFYDSVAPDDRARKCGNTYCVVLGNIETAKGTLRRQ